MRLRKTFSQRLPPASNQPRHRHITIKAVFPRFQPMPLDRAREPFSHPEWLYEIKHDGFRALLYCDSNGVRLVFTATYRRFSQLRGREEWCSTLPACSPASQEVGSAIRKRRAKNPTRRSQSIPFGI